MLSAGIEPFQALRRYRIFFFPPEDVSYVLYPITKSPNKLEAESGIARSQRREDLFKIFIGRTITR